MCLMFVPLISASSRCNAIDHFSLEDEHFNIPAWDNCALHLPLIFAAVRAAAHGIRPFALVVSFFVFCEPQGQWLITLAAPCRWVVSAMVLSINRHIDKKAKRNCYRFAIPAEALEGFEASRLAGLAIIQTR